ncbi:MAG TPA: isoprenyl transferase [Clostridiales bacterium]|nr:isoprenyl transferase [Clostridiales bacterium]
MYSEIDNKKLPVHVAVIMDGNRRWSKENNKNKFFGHREGMKRLEELIETTGNLGIKYLTIYAFSTENWGREKEEVSYLMDLLVEFAKLKSRVLESKGINVNIFGSIEELPPKTQDAVKNLCKRTKNNNELYLNIALNYGSRKEIVDAVKNIIGEYRENNEIYNEIDEEYIKNFLYSKNIPDPDFLIRTSGEQRLSNFLLYQLAYTELYFTETLWPDFGKEEYIKALKEYEKRNRRYGTS